MACPVLLTEFELLEFSGRRTSEFVSEVNFLRAFVAANFFFVHSMTSVSVSDEPGVVTTSAVTSSPLLIRNTDHRNLRNIGVLENGIFNFN